MNINKNFKSNPKSLNNIPKREKKNIDMNFVLQKANVLNKLICQICSSPKTNLVTRLLNTIIRIAL